MTVQSSYDCETICDVHVHIFPITSEISCVKQFYLVHVQQPQTLYRTGFLCWSLSLLDTERV